MNRSKPDKAPSRSAPPSPSPSPSPSPRSRSPVDKPLWPRSLSKGFAAVHAKELGGRRSPLSPGGSSLEDVSRSESPAKKPPPRPMSPSLSRRSMSPTKKSSAREAFAVVHAEELDEPSPWRLPGLQADSAAACLAAAARDIARQLPSSSVMVPPQGKATAMPRQGKATAMPRQSKATTKATQTPQRSVPLALAAPEVPSVYGHGCHGPTMAQRKLVPRAVALLTDEEPCALFYDVDQLRTTLGSISAAFPPSATRVPECSNHFP